MPSACWKAFFKRLNVSYGVLIGEGLPHGNSSLMKLVSETTLARSYFFTGGGCEHIQFIQVNLGLYNLGKGHGNIQEGKLKAEAIEMPH